MSRENAELNEIYAGVKIIKNKVRDRKKFFIFCSGYDKKLIKN
jgi:hypothetical protein